MVGKEVYALAEKVTTTFLESSVFHLLPGFILSMCIPICFFPVFAFSTFSHICQVQSKSIVKTV